MGRSLMIAAVTFLVALVGSSASAWADLQLHKDENGVLHIMNSIPEKRELPTSHPTLAQRDPELYNEILHVIRKHARKHRIDARLVQAVIRVESNFNPRARSHKDAMGLMQLIPTTARYLGVDDPYDIDQNIRGGVTYLAKMLKRHNGNVKLALASYNAGPGAVDRFGGIPPYRETQRYVRSVLRHYNVLKAAPVAIDGIVKRRTGGTLVIESVN